MCSISLITGIIKYCMIICNRKCIADETQKINYTRMWANAQPDGRPAEHRWRPLFNAAKFG